MDSIGATLALQGRSGGQWSAGDPLATSNRVDLLVDSDVYYPAVIALCDSARRELIVDMYIMGGPIGDRLAETLGRAKSRGVSVWVTTSPVYDSWGIASERIAGSRAILNRLGIEIREFPLDRLPASDMPPIVTIDHAKAVVADRKVAIIGGANFIDLSDMDHDVMARVEGPLAAEIATSLERPFEVPIGVATADVPGNANCSARLVVTDIHHQDSKALLLERIHSAKSTIDVGIYEFSDLEIAESLVAAHERGVRIRVLADRQQFDGKWVGGILSTIPHDGLPNLVVIERLLKGGVQVHWYDPSLPLQEMHLKYAIFDREIGFMGSLNWTPSAFHVFREMNIEFDGSPAGDLQALFESDWAGHSSAVAPLNLGQRVQARIVRWMDETGIVYW